MCVCLWQDDFLLIHYDKGPCRNKLGHSRASVIWHRTQVRTPTLPGACVTLQLPHLFLHVATNVLPCCASLCPLALIPLYCDGLVLFWPHNSPKTNLSRMLQQRVSFSYFLLFKTDLRNQGYFCFYVTKNKVKWITLEWIWRKTMDHIWSIKYDMNFPYLWFVLTSFIQLLFTPRCFLSVHIGICFLVGLTEPCDYGSAPCVCFLFFFQLCCFASKCPLSCSYEDKKHNVKLTFNYLWDGKVKTSMRTS